MVNQIILLNGPKGSGKDTLAKYLSDSYPECISLKFAKPLKDACHTLAGLYTSTDYFEGAPKDLPCAELPFNKTTGKHFTPRELYITLSENFVKPFLSEDYFGRAAVNMIKNIVAPDTIVFSDSGFLNELEPLIKEFGAEKLLQVKIFRRFHRFDETDSRDYWHHPEVKSVDFNNWGQLEDVPVMVQTQLAQHINFLQ